MTDNFDEFEQEQFEPESASGTEKAAGTKVSPKEILNKPVVKLSIIIGVIGLAIAGALGAFSDDKAELRSNLVQPPSMKQAPGGSVTPYFAEQNKMANEQRVNEAIAKQGSAMPTPIGKSVDSVDIDALAKKGSAEEFRAETERLRREWQAEKRKSDQKLQVIQQQMQKRTAKQDDTLAQAMQKQLQQLMDSWSPKKIKVVNGVEPVGTTSKTDSINKPVSAQNAVVQTQPPAPVDKVILPAGTVNYAQLLTEANSDVPGPIMVQVLSGPFSGGRAIGSFKVMYEQLVMTFNLVIWKGKEYSINAIALDPDTTLSAMATDVDHRYLKRVLLPAAASFLSGFGDALSSAGSQTTVSGDSVVINEVEKGTKEALFEGMASAGDTVARFLEREAAQTKTLVRVTTGAAMGLFFLQSVKESGLPSQQAQGLLSSQGTSARTNGNTPEAMARAYQQSGYGQTGYGQTGYGMPNVSSYPSYDSSMEQSGQSGREIKSPGGRVTIYK